MLLLTLVWIGVRAIGFSGMRRWAESSANAPGLAGCGSLPLEAAVHAQRCASLTAAAARHGLYRANCLHQALALCRLLRRGRIPAQLKVGVKKGRSTLDAHAWVELEGEVLGAPVTGYAAFERLEAMQKLPS